MMNEAQITVGSLSSFLLYAAYTGISVAGNSHPDDPLEWVGGGGIIIASLLRTSLTKHNSTNYSCYNANFTQDTNVFKFVNVFY